MSVSDPDIDYDNPILDILHAEETRPDWLIENVMLAGTLVCLAGAPAAGKSYLSYSLSLALASGVSALSGIVPAGNPQRVVYFDQENSPANRNAYLTRSWHGLRDSHGVLPDDGLIYEHFMPVHFYLGQKNWLEKAARFVDYFEPALVVFDTAASAFGIVDENSNAEAAQVIGEIRTLMAHTNPMATVLVLKHARSTPDDNGKYRIRGATMWQSLVDQTLFHIKMQGRPRNPGLKRPGLGKLSPTRVQPDKTRAFGLSQTIYIEPSYTDEGRTGLLLEGTFEKSAETKRALARERGKRMGDEDDDD